MIDYILSTTTQYQIQNTFGLNLHNIGEWIGNYLIKNTIGVFFSILYEYRYWIIAGLVFSVILYTVKKAFSFYKIRV